MFEVKKLKKHYIEFGKLQINETQLHTNNKLMISYISGSPVMNKDLRTQIISDDLASILIGIIDTLPQNEIDVKKVNRLSAKERKIFNSLIHLSGLARDLKYKQKPITVQDMVDRFEIVQGSIIAGNDSQEVINEAIELIKDLRLAGRIPADKAVELLEELKNK